ncbi:hypothetical protein Sjap_023952 [Stephania japonica]|uniref:Uncharacterized protein n=1 Tax=Stephania japonica TaxID=461633 RepID=A0AAP0ECK5_9MAGN
MTPAHPDHPGLLISRALNGLHVQAKLTDATIVKPGLVDLEFFDKAHLPVQYELLTYHDSFEHPPQQPAPPASYAYQALSEMPPYVAYLASRFDHLEEYMTTHFITIENSLTQQNFHFQQLEDRMPPPRLREDGPSRSARHASSQQDDLGSYS